MEAESESLATPAARGPSTPKLSSDRYSMTVLLRFVLLCSNSSDSSHPLHGKDAITAGGVASAVVSIV